MIFKILKNRQIWAQFILKSDSDLEREIYSRILLSYGTFFYIEADIIEFESNCFDSAPNNFIARAFVENLNEEIEKSLVGLI